MSDSPSSERWNSGWRIHKGIDQDDVIFGPDVRNPSEGEPVVSLSEAESLLTQERQRVEELEATLEETLNELAVTHDRAEDLAERIEELEGVLELIAEEARSPASIEEIVCAALSSKGERLKAEMERHGDDLRDLADD